MGKTKAGKGKIVARIFLVIGILLSMTAGSGLAYVKHTGDKMLGLMNYDKSNKVSGMDLSKYALDSDTEIVHIYWLVQIRIWMNRIRMLRDVRIR